MEVVRGKVVAGELAIAACERHLRDLKDGPARGLVWDLKSASRCLQFFPACLTITAGMKAGAPFSLLPWHTFCAGSLFGWRRKDSGRLRYRSGWFETGKGQAKSPLMAAIGLYMMAFYGIPRAQVFAIGQDRNTANVLFRDAVAMCRAKIGDSDDDDDSMVGRGDIIVRGEGDNAWKLEHPDSGSVFQSLANGEARAGPRPCCVLADEIHEFKSAHPIETWARAITKMAGDALMLLGTNTPATTQIVGTNYSEKFQRIAKGEAIDDEAFAYICRVDKADRDTVFDNPKIWPKALPALGVTFPEENIRGEVNTARIMLSTALSVQRLYFGIPVGSDGFWIAEQAWNAVQGNVDEEALRGRKCHLALDLSQKNDLTALTAVWEDDDQEAIDTKEDVLQAKTFYWTTKDGLEDREKSDNAPYCLWAAGGHITATPGAVIDYTFVAAKVAELCASHTVADLAFDVAFMLEFERACEEIGFAVWRYKGPEEPEGVGLKLVAHAQGTRVMFEEKQLCMPRSIVKLEDRILARRIIIAASPVTQSCAANAQLIVDGQKNRAFDKKRSRGRIDGVVTIAMGTGAATAHESDAPRSAYDVIGAKDTADQVIRVQAMKDAGDDGEIDYAALQNPAHPLFAVMAQRFEEKMALEDDGEL